MYDRLHGALHTQSLIHHLSYWIVREEITFMMLQLQLSILFIPCSPVFPPPCSMFFSFHFL